MSIYYIFFFSTNLRFNKILVWNWSECFSISFFNTKEFLLLYPKGNYFGNTKEYSLTKKTNRIDNCKQGKLFMHIEEACCFQNSKTRYYLCCQNQYQIQFVCVLLSIYSSFMCLWTYMLILSVSSFLLYSSSFCTISKFNLLNIRVIYSL